MTKLCERTKRAAARLGWPGLLVVAAIAWQFRAPLLGRVWCFEDIAAYFVPLYTAAARSMRTGGFPVWDLGAWSGQPLIGDPQLAVFYPLQWLWLVLSPVRLYAWLALVHAAIGAGGMWAWARARGRSTAAAALAALTLALGAFFVLQVRHAMFIATTAWLPWLLWAVERYGRERRLDHFLWIAVAGALALLAGGWSMLPYAAVVLLIVAASVIVRSHNIVQPHHKARLALLLAAAALLALALAAVAILPALAHARQSPRALGVTYEMATSYAWPSWRYVATLLLPTLYGDDARHTYVGAPDQWELCGYGIGAIASLLALASLLERQRRWERVALFVALAIACDLARGAGGLLHPLLYRLPLFSALRCPARALYLWTLAAPILAADGLDTIIVRLHNERWRAALRGLVLVAVALELAITWRSENPSTTRARAEARPQAISWLRDNGRPGRAVNDVHLPQRFHNMGLTWALESAGGYHSLPIWRYLHLLWISNHGRPYPHAQLNDDLTAQGLWRFSSPIVDLLGVQWVVTAHARPVDAPGFALVFTGEDGIDVYRNLQVYPRAFVVYRARRVDGEAAAARAVADPSWVPARVAIVEEAVAVPEPRSDEVAPPGEPARELVRLGATTLDLDLELPQPGVLVLGEPWYPGWRALVDGKPAPMLRVDYALRGVALPAGHHVVAMELVSTPMRVGGVISLLALLVTALLSAADARRRRNRS